MQDLALLLVEDRETDGEPEGEPGRLHGILPGPGLRVLRAEADRESQLLQRTKLTAQVVSDVETAYAGFAAAKALVDRMESTLLERARKARDITEIQYKAGSATLIDFLDAERTFIQTNTEYFTDLANYWTAVFQMEAAVGAELQDGT